MRFPKSPVYAVCSLCDTGTTLVFRLCFCLFDTSQVKLLSQFVESLHSFGLEIAYLGGLEDKFGRSTRVHLSHPLEEHRLARGLSRIEGTPSQFLIDELRCYKGVC